MNSASNQPTCKKIQNYIFKFADLLGQGNFSKVYKAHNQVTNETVAIKIVELNSLKSKKLEELLFSEIQVLKKLNHPNILRCYEVFTSNRNCYIITELCNEGDLESKIRQNRFFTEDKAIPIIKDIYQGLEYLSDKNVIHRDLKIANIFMHNGKAKIADFGFAKFTKTKFKDINIGSPIYMSPEGLIQNIYGPKTDVWAFGIMMYQLLHGVTPFSHCKTESQLKYCMSIPIGWSQLKSQLTSEIKQVMLKCLQVKQDKRFTIAELKNLSFFQNILTGYYQNQKNASWVSKSNNQITRNKSNQGEQKIQKTLNQKKGAFGWEDIDPFKHGNSSNIQKGSSQNNKSSTKEQSYSKDRGSNISGLLNKPTNQSLSYQGYLDRRQSFSNNNISDNKRPKSSLSKQNKILSSDITFKTCVNILHYCRLVYKYISIAGTVKQFKNIADENQKNVLTRWLAIVVKIINGRIDQRQVIYEGENAALREEKLKQVSKQYEKKYSKQLNLKLDKINPEQSSIANYEYMSNYLFTIYQQMDSILNKNENRQNKSLLMLGHYIIMIHEATLFLKNCYDQRNYKPFENYKDVQTLLNMKKDEMDLPSYWWYKKKFIASRK